MVRRYFVGRTANGRKLKGRNQKTSYKPTGSKFSILRQLCNLIPPHLVPQLARDTGVEDHTRTFSPWSQAVSLLYAQLTHALGLNDVCDALRLHSGPLSALRAATPLRKNTFSYANRSRDPKMADQLFRAMLAHLQTLQPAFAGHHTPRFAFRFKRLIHVVDTTTIVEVDGELREMVFLTNNFIWSAQTIADLYRCRWSIEPFFKELKQTLQLADFLGHNGNVLPVASAAGGMGAPPWISASLEGEIWGYGGRSVERL